MPEIVLLIISALAAFIYNPEPPIINGQNILGVETVCNPKGAVDETTWEYAGAFPVCLGSSQFLLYKCEGVSRYNREPCDKAPSSQPVPDSAPKPTLTAATAAPNCPKDLTCNPKTTKTEIIKSTWCKTDPGVCTNKGSGYKIKSTYKCGAKKTRIISERCTPAPPSPSPQPPTGGTLPVTINDHLELFYVDLEYNPVTKAVTQLNSGKTSGDAPYLIPNKPAQSTNNFVYRVKVVSDNKRFIQKGYNSLPQDTILTSKNTYLFRITTLYKPNATIKVYDSADKLFWSGKII